MMLLFYYHIRYKLVIIILLNASIIQGENILKFNPKGRISALEFLVSVLTYGNLVDKEKDIDPILTKFSRLDKDRDGKITSADLQGGQDDLAGGNVSLPELVLKDFFEVLFGSGSDDSSIGSAHGRLISGETAVASSSA